MKDDVKKLTSHPSYYNKEGRKECIDEMVDIFGLYNTIQWALMTCYKYRYRLGAKDNEEMELAKIQWYENWIREQVGICEDYAFMIPQAGINQYIDKFKLKSNYFKRRNRKIC